jgi:hypothetical protein
MAEWLVAREPEGWRNTFEVLDHVLPMSRAFFSRRPRSACPASCPTLDFPLAQTLSTLTPFAWFASALRSSGSEVSAVPPGSANAMTRASTAEPRRARLRSSAARRASGSETPSTTSHVFRKRFASASRAAWPCRHSTSTTDGTTGGQSPSSRRARISAAACRVRSASLLTPPESRTSTARHPASRTRRCERRRATAPARAR